jgi:hypothetical protein
MENHSRRANQNLDHKGHEGYTKAERAGSINTQSRVLSLREPFVVKNFSFSHLSDETLN